MSLRRLLAASSVIAFVLLATSVDARKHQKPIETSLPSDRHGFSSPGATAEQSATTGRRRIGRSPRQASYRDGRPRRWCGWQMRQWFGGGKHLNLARNWAHEGTRAGGPCIGCVVVWGSHVGYITGRTAQGWVVKSGNDGGRVRERVRSVKGAIAFRHVGRVAGAIAKPAAAAKKPVVLKAAAPPREKLQLTQEIPVEWETFIADGMAYVETVLDSLEQSRLYLVKTATIGGTMARQTPEVAIGRLHPTFAKRLAPAIKKARANGLPKAGCYSAYREPIFGIGGYANKFDSNHAYGLYCDMAGIGRPNSREHKLWHRIATEHGLYNPYYGTRAYWEWNHYGVTPTVKAVAALPALRNTITARGPKDNETMWRVASVLIDKKVGGGVRIATAKKHKSKRTRYVKRYKKPRRYASA